MGLVSAVAHKGQAAGVYGTEGTAAAGDMPGVEDYSISKSARMNRSGCSSIDM
jgi:hypothetical protein